MALTCMNELKLCGEADCLKTDSPIDSAEELFNWTPDSEQAKKCTPAKLVSHQGRKPVNHPEVLFCHDMRGGYLDDACTYGNENSAAYRFYHWHLIDIFTYFGHQLVVIPPVGWVDVAHRNGVRVHGCLVTEHWVPSGQRAFPALFKEEASALLAAEKLDQMRRHFHFEGWLINIESFVENKDQISVYIENILTFLNRLKQLGSEVIWYDAITTDGSLTWQNALTPANSAFFAAASGIFLNYTWTPDLHLAPSRDLAASMATTGEAGEISRRVYVGVDCFGRGCLGGGGWNIGEALAAIQRDNLPPLSIALFAPGWVYEHHEEKCKTTGIQDSNFLSDNQKFWAAIASHVQYGGGNIACSYSSNTVLDTNFCLGQGEAEWYEGALVKRRPWNWLRAQQILPTCYPNPASGVEMCPEKSCSYTGGSCLRISLTPQSSTTSSVTLPLFTLVSSPPLSQLRLVFQESTSVATCNSLLGVQIRQYYTDDDADTKPMALLHLSINDAAMEACNSAAETVVCGGDPVEFICDDSTTVNTSNNWKTCLWHLSSATANSETSRCEQSESILTEISVLLNRHETLTVHILLGKLTLS